jgi:peptidoglycan-N-acetylglucosamine deacetylase
MDRTSSNFIVTTSWDDGHPLDMRLADLLAKHELPGTFYLPYKNSRPTLSSSQIRHLATRFETGAHTMHHHVLPEISRQQARDEVFQSKAWLEDLTGRVCSVFCFPKGRFRSAHVRMVGEAGFKGARTVELLSVQPPSLQHGVLMIPTTLQATPSPMSTYLCNSLKRRRFSAFRDALVEIRGKSWTDAALHLLHRCALMGGVFHLWGHSWEIEEQQQWTSLELIFAAMAATQSNRLTNAELCDRKIAPAVS